MHSAAMPPNTIDEALACHIDWLGRVVAAAQGGRVPRGLLEETAHKQCAFARWLDAREGSGGQFAEMRRLHDAMHDSATALLRLVEDGKESFAAFDRLSREAVAFNRMVADWRRRLVNA